MVKLKYNALSGQDFAEAALKENGKDRMSLAV